MRHLLVLLALPLTASAAYIDSNLAVSSEAQMGGGGCYPVPLKQGFADQLNMINPEWAAIDVDGHTPPEADPITLHGTVTFAKINEEGDFPGDHVSDDQNTFLDIDPADMGFVATGNVGPHGEEGGQLELELEIVKYPLFAWGGPGDRMTTVGRWIWDCGHQDPDPLGSCSTTTSQACVADTDCAPSACGTCVQGEICVGTVFNYHSELHPPQAVAVSRLSQGHGFSRKRRGGRLATRTDVWITPDGGGAGDRCIVMHRDNALSLPFTVDCFPFSEPLANVNASDFAFDIPLPPRPVGSPGLRRIKVIDATPHGLPRPKVRTSFVDGSPPLVHAVVDMTTPVRGRLPSMVGKTIFTGWRRERTPMTRLQVAVTAIEIVNPLKPVQPVVPQKQRCSQTTNQDCSASACPEGEQCLTLGGPVPGWEIFLEANGHWEKLTGLENVMTPVTVPQSVTYDLSLPATGTLRLRATGHSLECRETLYGMALSRILRVYGFDDGPSCLQSTSHEVGDLDLPFTAPDFGSGSGSMDHVSASVGGEGGTCSSTTTQLCLTNADCPEGETCAVTGASYRLHYTIRRVP